MTLKRFGSAIRLRLEKLEEYKQLHAAAWPKVLQMIGTCNIQNYSIYLGTMDDGNPYLFSYFEYTGHDIEADMAKMAADPTTREWWALCKPCQTPLAHRKEGEWWMDLEEIFHTD